MKKLMFAFGMAVAIMACNRPPANFEGGEPPGESVALRAPVLLPERVKVKRADVVERKLIKNGTITFSTSDISKTRKEIENVCKEFSAYVSSDEQQSFDKRIQYEQVIRIPAGRFDAFTKVIESLGEHVEYRNITTQDVTEEFIDIGARLKTKKELEIRYHQLLAKAIKVDDMLSIEEQIANVRTEIESMEGRLNFLTNQVGYSTLTLTYHQVVASDFGFGTQMMSSFVTGWNGLLVFLVGIVKAWPFILIMGAGFWLTSRWIKRINLARHSKTENV
ncbi:MAG TPA: DUF4349 domain-containing protein [Chryseosolibacter sp.]